MRVKTATEGKTKDVAIIDVTPENYIVPDNEKHLYHCVIEIKKFDSETGKRLSIPRIQKFGKKGYENSIAENLKKQGYTITVLHDPNEYMKAKAEADAKAKAAEKIIEPAKITITSVAILCIPAISIAVVPVAIALIAVRAAALLALLHDLLVCLLDFFKFFFRNKVIIDTLFFI